MRALHLNTSEVFNEQANLRALIEAAPQDGYDMRQIRTASKVLDRLESLGEAPLRLEDDEYAFVWARVSQAKWMRAASEIVAFVDKIENAERIDP